MRKIAAVLALGLFALISLATRPGSDVKVVHAATPTTFNFTGAEQNYQVPAGVTRVMVDVRGARGGDSNMVTGNAACTSAPQGGQGYRITGILAVNPLDVLFVTVGGVGTVPTGGFNGGGSGGSHPNPLNQGAGGGGASDIRTGSGNPATRIVVAPGGGGAGGCGGQAGDGGGGGPYNTDATPGTPAGTGGGGGQRGSTGLGAAGTHGSSGTAPTAGNSTTGGNGGSGVIQTSTTGSGGGGGGGHNNGGGGGGAGAQGGLGAGGGGGGGGGSFAGPLTSGANSGNPNAGGVGSVTITPIDPPTVTKSFNPASIQVNGSSIVAIVLSNLTNAFPLTGVSFTDNLPAGVTTNGAPTTFPGHPSCGGTLSSTATSVTLTGGTIAANSTCAVGISVTSATAGTYVNQPFAVATTQGVSANSNPATLLVTATPATATPPPATPTATSTPVPPVVIPVIPQVFQHVPQGIFYGNRSTPTPVVRAAVAPVLSNPPAAMPVLRPPSTGDGGLKDERNVWSYAPFVAIATVFAASAGAVWRFNRH